MPVKALLIINPISGTRKKEGLDRFISERLAPLGWEIDAMFTRAHGDAARFAADAAARGADAVIVAGGDGTVNEAATGLCGTATTLGIIPLGSGNGLARHVEIPMDIRGALDVIALNRSLSIDYATVNGRPFFCTFGVGFDAAVSETFARHRHRGKLTYLKSTFETYKNFTPEEYRIETDGEHLTDRAFLVAVCNASQYGNNAYIAPGASIVDGLLDVVILHDGNPFATALVGVDMMIGNLSKNALFETIRTSRLTIRRKNSGPAHIDGDPVEMGDCLDIECHPKSLRIFVPAQEHEFKPILTPVSALFSDIKTAVNNIIFKD